ncbi:MAG: hypothetical protein ACRDRW_22365 [Pseudonocardiaceae bacterium]
MSIHLGQVLLTAVVTAVVSLLVMESYQTTPWLAAKLMRWSVRLRYADNPERATVRGEELISLLGDLPTLFKLPTAGGFLFCALAYRLVHRRGQVKREPRTGQRSLGARFRIALVKAILVFGCTSTVLWIEFFVLFVIVASPGESLIVCSVCGILGGISAASEVVSRLPRLRPGLIGGIICMLSIFVLRFVTAGAPRAIAAEDIFSGAVFGLAIALVVVLVGKFKHVGVVLGVLVHFSGATLIILSRLLSESVAFGVFFIGLGFMAGSLAGFAVVVERGVWRKVSRDRSPVLPGIPG